MNDLRVKARERGVYLRVVRNTLARRAVEGTEFECMRDGLVGPLLLAFAIPFGLYLLTLAPTVTFEDSGELIAAPSVALRCSSPFSNRSWKMHPFVGKNLDEENQSFTFAGI